MPLCGPEFPPLPGYRGLPAPTFGKYKGRNRNINYPEEEKSPICFGAVKKVDFGPRNESP